MEVGALLLTLEVHQDANGSRHRALHGELAGADQWYVAETNGPRGRSGELGRQIFGRSEDDTHELVVLQAVSREHLVHQPLRLAVDLLLGVGFAGNCTSERQRSHDGGG